MRPIRTTGLNMPTVVELLLLAVLYNITDTGSRARFI